VYVLILNNLCVRIGARFVQKSGVPSKCCDFLSCAGLEHKKKGDRHGCPSHEILRSNGPVRRLAWRRSHAAPSARRCWKHSRQKTGRPCVGRKGTVVSFPHWEQVVFVSERICEAPPPPPPPSARLALQPLHLFGSFLKPLSAKNICSPAVKTNSAPHSAHFSTRSWYSMSRSPLARVVQGDGHISH
jgi:hypothetical protein